MPINQGPWAALIDDDGSNTIGTPWNKAAIKSVLIDPIDANLPVFQAVPFSPADFRGAGGLVWTVGAAAVLDNRVALIGNSLMVWSFYVSWFSGANGLSGAPGLTLEMAIPFGRSAGANTMLVMNYCAGIAGVPVLAGLRVAPGAGVIAITKADATNFALSDVPGMITTLIFEVR